MVQKKRNKKCNKESYVNQDASKLTPSQASVLSYLLLNYRVSQIASIKGCSTAYIRKVRIKLREMGLLSKVTLPYQSVTNVTKKDKRVHANHWTIELIRPISDYYIKNMVNKSFLLDGHRVRCFSKSVIVQCEKGFGVNGVDENSAYAESERYWGRYFIKLENELKTIIVKERSKNITATFSEIATEDSKISKSCYDVGKRIFIYDPDDGKFRFSTDWSLKQEHEAHHAIKNKEDSENFNYFYDDIKDRPDYDEFIIDILDNGKKLPKLSEFSKILYSMMRQTKEMQFHNKETAAGLNSIVTYVKSQLPQEKIKDELPIKGVPDYVG